MSIDCPAEEFLFYINTNLCVFDEAVTFSWLFSVLSFSLALLAFYLLRISKKKIASITQPGIADAPDQTYCVLSLYMVRAV